jgi:hypothetical protein
MRDLAENTVWRRFRYPWSSADDLQYPVVAHRDRRHLSWRARDLDVIAIAGHDPLSVALYGRRTGILFDGDNLGIPGVCMYTSFQRSAPPSSALWILRRTSWWRTFSAATSKNQKTPCRVIRLDKPAPFGMLSATSSSGPFPAMGLACD